MKKTKVVQEVWGLLRPDGMILLSGYSERQMNSEAEVRSEFDKSLFEQGFTPVLIKTITTTTRKYT